jgi:hypothetical protein
MSGGGGMCGGVAGGGVSGGGVRGGGGMSGVGALPVPGGGGALSVVISQD